MKLKKVGCFVGIAIILVIFTLFILAIIFGKKTNNLTKNSPEDKLKVKIIDKVTGDKINLLNFDKIALVEIEGVISAFDKEKTFFTQQDMLSRIKTQLKRISKDDAFKAVILKINSPGGEVTASDIIYNELLKLKSKKPIIVYMQTVAASGGYYIACASDNIIASPTSITGSVGVIISTLNFPKLLDKINVSPITIKSGKLKDMLSPTREVTSEELLYTQKIVDTMFDRFINIVSKGRKISVDRLLETIGDGRILLGKDALDNGLIDKIGYIEDAYKKARALAKSPNAVIVKFYNELGFFDLLNANLHKFLFSSSKNNKVHIDVQKSLSPKIKPGMFYYLAEGFAH